MIICYTHIPKTGGITMTHIFRSIFGLRHCGVEQVREPTSLQTYTKRDLDITLKLHPGLRAVSGHPLRPYLDYGEHEARLRWFTMLRDPNERLYSQYRYLCARENVSPTFEQWCAETDGRWADLQVRWIAGERDLDKAKVLLRNKFVSVGDQAHFNTSLALFAQHFDEPRFPTSSTTVKNASVFGSSEFDRDVASRYNTLDIELYRYFKSEIWPQQVSEHRQFEDRPYVETAGNRIRNGLNRVYRKAVYKNVMPLMDGR